jgi:glycosyltransferase involved in cell wall biosynthesis
LIGDGPELQGCIEFAERIGLDVGRNIIFMGARDNAARYFNGADIGVQLSIEPEAFGLVFLEAMSRGKPVIGTDIGGIPEVVGDCGILVEPFDIDGAADAIERLVRDDALRIELGEKGKMRWRDHFMLERMVNDYIAYLQE